jgi:hypothetical protein
MTEKNDIFWYNIVSKCADHCWIFSLNLAIYRASRNDNGEQKSKDTDHMLRLMNSNNIFSATLSWCHFFGSDGDEHHWKNILPLEMHAEFKSTLIGLSGSFDAWSDYRNMMKSFRDQHIAHIDRAHGHVPNMEIAFQTIQAFYSALMKENERCPCWQSLPSDLNQEYEREKLACSKRIERLIEMD